MTMTFINLLTDFGLQDQYVFQMKAVIKMISPQSQILDITHGITKFSVKEGAFILAQAEKYFPKNSIAVAVVDPGVGSNRACLAIRTEHFTFIGPDNGILYEAAKIDGLIEVREITSNEIILDKGGTFDGRDVFAPAAAYIAEGFPFRNVGKKLNNISKYSFSYPIIKQHELYLEVLYIDHFGNIILNIQSIDFLKWAKEEIQFKIYIENSIFLTRLVKSYSELSGPGLLIGSSGLLELSTNMKGKVINKIRIGSKLHIKRYK